jgi:hypothetical protein
MHIGCSLSRFCHSTPRALQTFPQLGFFSTSRAPAHDDQLTEKCHAALTDIQAAGTLKVERQILTPQSAVVGVKEWQSPVLNFCKSVGLQHETPMSDEVQQHSSVCQVIHASGCIFLGTIGLYHLKCCA